jgi:hypothetical protein
MDRRDREEVLKNAGNRRFRGARVDESGIFNLPEVILRMATAAVVY